MLKILFLFSVLSVWEIESDLLDSGSGPLKEIKPETKDEIKEDIYSIYKDTMRFRTLRISSEELEEVTPHKITLYLYTKSNPKSPIKFNSLSPEKLIPQDPNTMIVFIIHGWLEHKDVPWYDSLKDAFLRKNHSYNVVEVDWSDLALKSYLISSNYTESIGQNIGGLISNLHVNYQVPLRNFLIVGHSLGGQIAGFAGKTIKKLTGQKMYGIVALDPAGPMFVDNSEKDRLNRDDAEIVLVIHTNGAMFGYLPSCGTIDFYPNGGILQPGCIKIDFDIMSIPDTIFCNHQRSFKYFIAALEHPNAFVGKKCDSWENFELNRCNLDEASMGNLKCTKTGKYFLETNSEISFS